MIFGRRNAPVPQRMPGLPDSSGASKSPILIGAVSLPPVTRWRHVVTSFWLRKAS
jgi:hypothetical protein